MIANTRKKPRDRLAEKKGSPSTEVREQKRNPYSPRPRHPNWLLLTISAVLFLAWLISLVLLAIWQS
jgi:hypothetical protein